MARVELVRYGKTKRYILIGTKNRFDLYNSRSQALTVKKKRESELKKKLLP